MTIENPTPQHRAYAWVSGVTFVLGVWTLFSSFALSFHHFTPGLWNNTLVGILVGVFALIRVSSLYDQRAWSWCNAVLGVWLIISPFALGFGPLAAARMNNIIIGALITVFGLISALLPKSQQREVSNTR